VINFDQFGLNSSLTQVKIAKAARQTRQWPTEGVKQDVFELSGSFGNRWLRIELVGDGAENGLSIAQ
jgi:hypothetical protein